MEEVQRRTPLRVATWCLLFVLDATVLTAFGTWAEGQGGSTDRISADFNGEPVGQVFETLQEEYGLTYAFAEGVASNVTVVAHLRGLTLDQAVETILTPIGLTAKNANGQYLIQERPASTAQGSRHPLLATNARTQAPPRPTRWVPQAGVPGESQGDDNGEQETILDIIWPKYLSAADAAMIFGGSTAGRGYGYAGASGGRSAGGYGGYARGGQGGSYGGGYSGSYTAGQGSSAQSAVPPPDGYRTWGAYEQATSGALPSGFR